MKCSSKRREEKQLLKFFLRIWSNLIICRYEFCMILKSSQPYEHCWFETPGFKTHKTAYLLQGQCHEIFKSFFIKKTSPGPIRKGKNGFTKFQFSRRYSRKFAKFRKKTCVHVVVDYADTMLARSMTTLALCQHSH